MRLVTAESFAPCAGEVIRARGAEAAPLAPSDMGGAAA